MRHLLQAWAALGTSTGGGRFVHVTLPDNPGEAHRLLVSLARGGRTAATEPTEYDQARLHDLVADEGYSHHPGHGKAPARGFMVSYHAPEGSGLAAVHHMSKLGPEHIAAHREAASDHLSRPSTYQGGWWDKSDDHVYLDVSKHFDHEPEARKFAVHEKQKAYFDLNNFESMYLHPKHDPHAMKDEGGWRQKYSHLPAHEQENPPAGYEHYAHEYPPSDDQKKFWADKGHHLGAKGRMTGIPVGPWWNDLWVEARMKERSQ